MSWPSFTTPGAAWLALLALPLLLLYFLKLRRPRLELASLVLWQQVLRDERVNAPLRRLKRSLLLLLQLLALLLLVLAAMQPVWRAGFGAARRVLLLVDRSASMAALDRPGGTTRLTQAKQQARALVAGLESDQEMAILAFAGNARLLAPFTGERRVLRDVIDQLDVADQPDDLEAALRMAGAMAETTAVERVVLLSDGNLPEATSFALPFAIEWVRLPPGGQNLGITKLHASREPGGGWRILVTIESNAEQPPPARARLLQDGVPRFDEAVFAKAGEAQRLLFEVAASARTAIEVVLQIDGFDALAADDHAYLELLPPRALRARVAPKLTAFDRALRALKGVEVVDSGAAADVVVSDESADLDCGAPVVLTVGVIPAALDDLLQSRDGGSSVVDWSRSEPLLDHVELGDLLVLEQLAWRDNHGEADLEHRGFTVLVHGDRGPLMVRRGLPQGRGQACALLFDAARSTLPYRLALPILTANLVGMAMQATGLREAQGLCTGVLPLLDLPAGEITLVDPSGRRTALWPDASKSLRMASAERAGWYVFERQGVELRRLGANLLDRDESLLGARDELHLHDLTVASAGRQLAVNHPLGGMLSLVALLILSLEWWWFRRAPRKAGARR